jgi:hypothetical protein
MPTSRPLPVLRADRLRRPPRSYAWLDHRLRSGGFLARLDADALALYCFLALAADARGLSCWRLDRIERQLPLDLCALHRARGELLRKDLVAFQSWSPGSTDGVYQLLELPPPTSSLRIDAGAVPIAQLLPGLGASGR